MVSDELWQEAGVASLKVKLLYSSGWTIQGEHKVFPLLETFITRKLHGIQTYFFTIT